MSIMQASVDNPTPATVAVTGTITDTFYNLSIYMPLALGAMFFASDTKQLFFGTPGVGIGYIQIGDTTMMNDTLLALLRETKAMRLALVALACQGNQNKPEDFTPERLATDPEIEEAL